MVMHANPDKEEAKAGYLRALKEFIKDRMAGNIAKAVLFPTGIDDL